MNIPKFTIAALSMTTAASAWAVNSDVSNRHVVMDPSSSLSTKAAETPLSELLDLTDVLGPKVAEYNALNPLSPISLLAKAEFRNPASKSHKDRIARAIIREAACRGDLTRKDGGKKTIIAASSGNTGAAVTKIGTQMGYDVTIITNKKCSTEKCNNIRNAGATLWMAEDLPSKFPDALNGVNCYMKQERVLCERHPDEYFSCNQYDNLDNMMAHYETTAEEIWDQSNGAVTHFVMAASTGGTITGVGKALKEKSAGGVRVVLSDPHKSNLAGILEKARGNAERGAAMLEEVKRMKAEEGDIQVEGAGKGELTEIMMLDGEVLKYVDDCVPVHDFDAFDACREIEAKKGYRIGGSAGLNICACRRVAEDLVDAGIGGGASIVTLLCDDGNKYASKIYNDEWIEANDTRGSRPRINQEMAMARKP